MDINFNTLIGKTIEYIGKHFDSEHNIDRIMFLTKEEIVYEMYHDQDCCETVYLYDIIGDLTDLLNSPITMAEVVTNSDNPPEGEYIDSFTWTFYKLATVNGYVTLRWLGQSNGYYSEYVSFKIVNN